MQRSEAELTTRLPVELPTILGGPPDYLFAGAREEWLRVTQELGATGILHEVDRSMLAAYCCCYGLYREALDHVKKHGLLLREPVRNSGGKVTRYRLVRNPAVSIIREELSLMRSFAALFGLSPLHRKRLRR